MAPSRQGFPETTWGMLSRFQDSPQGDYRAGLQTLCTRYWKPIQRYLRHAWAKSEEDAKDLTQSFLLWLLERETLKKYAPDRGSFRTFLKALLRHFVDHDRASRARVKRGGRSRIVALDDLEGRRADRIPDPRSAEPEKILDREWVAALIDGAVDRVRETFAGQRREKLFQAFEIYHREASHCAATYSAIAARLSLRESQVRRYLHVVRRAVRSEIRAEVARLTRDERELEEEWRTLFGGDTVAELGG